MIGLEIFAKVGGHEDITDSSHIPQAIVTGRLSPYSDLEQATLLKLDRAGWYWDDEDQGWMFVIRNCNEPFLNDPEDL
jgi:hypothetical protein